MASAVASFSIHVEWQPASRSGSSTVTAYTLYQEGRVVCLTNVPASTSMDCTVSLTTESTYFTITATFSDGTESPHSEPYYFRLPPVEESEQDSGLGETPAVSQPYSLTSTQVIFFNQAWPGDPYQHYLAYGDGEDVNPSNDFDVSAYLEEKLAALQANPATASQYNSIADLRVAFKASGMTTLGHFLHLGVREGLSAHRVPNDEQVHPLSASQ